MLLHLRISLGLIHYEQASKSISEVFPKEELMLLDYIIYFK